MKVLCINDKDSIGNKSPFYTKGKWYEVVDTGSSYIFYLKSDNGTHPAVEAKNFISVEEYRSQQINKILS